MSISHSSRPDKADFRLLVLLEMCANSAVRCKSLRRSANIKSIPFAFLKMLEAALQGFHNIEGQARTCVVWCPNSNASRAW